MDDEMIPGLLLALCGLCAWLVATVGWWLRPAPARPPFRALRAAAAISALTTWVTVAGAVWAITVLVR